MCAALLCATPGQKQRAGIGQNVTVIETPSDAGAYKSCALALVFWFCLSHQASTQATFKSPSNNTSTMGGGDKSKKGGKNKQTVACNQNWYYPVGGCPPASDTADDSTEWKSSDYGSGSGGSGNHHEPTTTTQPSSTDGGDTEECGTMIVNGKKITVCVRRSGRSCSCKKWWSDPINHPRQALCFVALSLNVWCAIKLGNALLRKRFRYLQTAHRINSHVIFSTTKEGHKSRTLRGTFPFKRQTPACKTGKHGAQWQKLRCLQEAVPLQVPRPQGQRRKQRKCRAKNDHKRAHPLDNAQARMQGLREGVSGQVR
jgi:hypothetical protein